MSTDTAPQARPIKAKPKLPTSDRYQFVCSEYQRAVERGSVQETTVLEFIAVRRAVTDEEPTPIPFRRIAMELGQVTGVDITHEAVRRWFRSTEAAAHLTAMTGPPAA